jgi:hypothetical protein
VHPLVATSPLILAVTNVLFRAAMDSDARLPWSHAQNSSTLPDSLGNEHDLM